MLEKYSKQINIEAGVAYEMATREILPACSDYAVELAAQLQTLEASGREERIPQEEAHRRLQPR